jgi:hypothetical protein
MSEIDGLAPFPFRSDFERAIENMIDMIVGALSAPVSIEVTRRLES